MSKTTWKCPRCGTSNSNSKDECHICGQRKNRSVNDPLGHAVHAENEDNSDNTGVGLVLVGVVTFVIQLVFFFIGKSNFSSSYHEDVVGTIRIGDMSGVDTTVSHLTSTTGLGVAALVIMCICLLTFFILGGLYSSYGEGNLIPIFILFIVITIIGILLVVFF